VFRPISPDEDTLPADVREFASSLRGSVPAPRIGQPHPGTRQRPVDPRRRDAPGSGVTIDELDELDELEDLDLAPPAGRPGRNEAPKLDHWTVRAHVYTSEVAARIGILAGLFGGSGKVVKAGAMDEAKRFYLETTESGRHIEVGVAVRLAVAATEWEAQIDLSLPNIAAAAQLGMKTGDAQIGIEVAGYSGALGDLLPAPRQLDVATLSDYLSAFHAIQAQVFGRSGLPFLTPAVLTFDDGEAPDDR
jgi:hypothetical protein